MKAWWEKLSARVDALSLRERAFLFLSVLACCMALVDVMWLSPAQVAHKQLTQQFGKQNMELKLARDTLTAVAQPADTNNGLVEEVALLKNQLELINQHIRTMTPEATTDTTPLAQVLVHLLRRNEGLTLVRTTALATEALSVKATPGMAPDVRPSGLTRQGVELTVSGAYPDLARYVQTLENSLPYVRWGVMKLKSDKLPPELTLQLFLVGVQP